MENILRDLTRPALAAAVKINLYEFFRSIRCSALSEYVESAGLERWFTPVPHPWFNAVLATRPPGAHDASAIVEILADFRARRVPVFTWWLWPGLAMDEWSRVLSAQGFLYDDQTPGMAVNLDAPTLNAPGPDRFTIQIVDSTQLLQTWTRIFLRGYGVPENVFPQFHDFIGSLGLELPYRHYLGSLEGQPVAASSLFLGAGVAGIYNVATLPEARGRGFGAAMTAYPLHQARDLGYRAGILQSSTMGFPVYRRLGFERVTAMDHFYWKAPEQST